MKIIKPTPIAGNKDDRQWSSASDADGKPIFASDHVHGDFLLARKKAESGSDLRKDGDHVLCIIVKKR